MTIAFVVSALGCGSATPPAEQSVAAEPATAPEPTPEPLPESATESKDESPGAGSSEESASPGPDQSARDVTYTQTPEGLKIEVSGVSFIATATPARAGGGWGVKVKVSATATDGKQHKLLNPKGGPLAFAGKVDRAGKIEELGDERAGDEEKTISESKLDFAGEWPGRTGAKPLSAGQSLELQVGLWGLGADSESLRPVRKFLVVKMVAGKKTPQPVVSPPSSAVREE